MKHMESIYSIYEREKSLWVKQHPDASPEQFEAACKAIAERLGL